MQFNTKDILFLAMVSLVSSFTGVFIYATLINPVKKIYIEESLKARKVAEEELLFSGKLQQFFNSSTPTDFIHTAKDGVEAVVFIQSVSRSKDGVSHTESYSSNSGSGVIVTSDGYIVTNNHVVDNASDIVVMLNNNREYKARLIGNDPYTDLAMLKIEGENLDYLILGNSDSLQVGEWVMAIGNPFRLQSSVTAGIVSAKGRNINILENQGIESFIQTDAVVNPGNSGGALVNTKGQLVGINTAIMSVGGNFEGYSFAVPSNLVKKVINDLKQYGAVQRGWMGVEIQDVDDARAKRLNLPDIEGVYIAQINKDGAADLAGLKNGDVILKLEGEEITNVPVFMEKIGRLHPGDIVRVEYFRDGIKSRTSVTLRNQLNSTDMVAVRKDKLFTDLGFELRDLDSFEKSRNKTTGIMVVSVYKNSKIADSRIEPGFIITKINKRKVDSVNDLESLLKATTGTVLLEGIYENYPGVFPYSIEIED